MCSAVPSSPSRWCEGVFVRRPAKFCSGLSSASSSVSGEGRVVRAAAVWQTPTCSSPDHNRSCVCFCVQERKGHREGPNEPSVPPYLLQFNDMDKLGAWHAAPHLHLQTAVRRSPDDWWRLPWCTDDRELKYGASVKKRKKSRSHLTPLSIMVPRRWPSSALETTHPCRTCNPTQCYVASAWCHSLRAYLSFFLDPLSNFRDFPLLSESPAL